MALLKVAKAVINKCYKRKGKQISQFIAPLPAMEESFDNKRNFKVHRPLIMFGTMRTGTTMLMDMLRPHPELVTTSGAPGGEDVEMWVELGGSTQAGIGKRESIGPVGNCFCTAQDETDISDGRVIFFHKGVLKRYPELLKEKRLLNGNTHLGNKIRYITRIFPDACLIFLIRDPYAVIGSLKRKLAMFPNLMFEVPNARDACINVFPKYGWSELPQKIIKSNPNIYIPDAPKSVRLLARYWKNTVLYIKDQAEADPRIPMLMIRYEDVIQDQNNSLQKLIDYCGLDSFKDWGVLANQGINKKRHFLLSEEERKIIVDELGSSLKNFGYDHLW